jgi:hypothetical protein
MAKVAVWVGIVLVVLGVGAYFGTGRASVTALIPAFFGAPLAGLGALAGDERRRRSAMHLAAALSLLGLLGSARGIPQALSLASGGVVERPAAAVVQSLMAVLCGLFLGLAVRSFVAARRARAPGSSRS